MLPSTGLAERTRSAEIFLLASAALANLTFLDGGCVGAMRRAGTARVLLRAARGNPSISIFTKDQVSDGSLFSVFFFFFLLSLLQHSFFIRVSRLTYHLPCLQTMNIPAIAHRGLSYREIGR